MLSLLLCSWLICSSWLTFIIIQLRTLCCKDNICEKIDCNKYKYDDGSAKCKSKYDSTYDICEKRKIEDNRCKGKGCNSDAEHVWLK